MPVHKATRETPEHCQVLPQNKQNKDVPQISTTEEQRHPHSL